MRNTALNARRKLNGKNMSMSLIDNIVTFHTVTPTLVEGEWIVRDEHTQIHGYLHGGISAAIAEHAASIGASCAISSHSQALGVSLETHHLRPVQLGSKCHVRAFLEHNGKTIHIWRVEQTLNHTGKPFNISTVTLYIKETEEISA